MAKYSPKPAEKMTVTRPVMDWAEACAKMAAGQKIHKQEWPAGWYGCFYQEELMIHDPASKYDYAKWEVKLADVLGEDYEIYHPS